MDDRRRIVIRDPRLRRFRNSLRTVIYKAADDLEDEIDEKWNALCYDELGNILSDLPDEIEQEVQNLNERREAINLALEESVVCCSLCHSLDQDVEYVQKFESWFCIKCARLY